jgi:hypothetical protein
MQTDKRFFFAIEGEREGERREKLERTEGERREKLERKEGERREKGGRKKGERRRKKRPANANELAPRVRGNVSFP